MLMNVVSDKLKMTLSQLDVYGRRRLYMYRSVVVGDLDSLRVIYTKMVTEYLGEITGLSTIEYTYDEIVAMEEVIYREIVESDIQIMWGSEVVTLKMCLDRLISGDETRLLNQEVLKAISYDVLHTGVEPTNFEIRSKVIK